MQQPYLHPRDQAVLFVPPQQEGDLRVPTAEEMGAQSKARVISQQEISKDLAASFVSPPTNTAPISEEEREIKLPAGLKVYAQGHPEIVIDSGGYSIILPKIQSAQDEYLHIAVFNFLVTEEIDPQIRFTFEYENENDELVEVTKENTQRIRSGWVLLSSARELSGADFVDTLLLTSEGNYTLSLPSQISREGWELSSEIQAYQGSLPKTDTNYTVYSFGIRVVPLLSFHRSPGEGSPDFSTLLSSQVWESQNTRLHSVAFSGDLGELDQVNFDSPNDGHTIKRIGGEWREGYINYSEIRNRPPIAIATQSNGSLILGNSSVINFGNNLSVTNPSGTITRVDVSIAKSDVGLDNVPNEDATDPVNWNPSKSDGNFLVGDGSTFVAESGSTARSSLGLGNLATLNSVSESDLAVSNSPTTSTFLGWDGSQLTWKSVPSSFPLTDTDTVTVHDADLMNISGGSVKTIFDLTTSADLLGGSVVGTINLLVRLLIDGTEVFNNAGNNSKNDAGDTFSSTALPVARASSSMTLEVYNSSSTTGSVSWVVYTK